MVYHYQRPWQHHYVTGHKHGNAIMVSVMTVEDHYCTCRSCSCSSEMSPDISKHRMISCSRSDWRNLLPATVGNFSRHNPAHMGEITITANQAGEAQGFREHPHTHIHNILTAIFQVRLWMLVASIILFFHLFQMEWLNSVWPSPIYHMKSPPVFTRLRM